MTKEELVAVACERKLVRTKTEARGMKVDALRALVEADAASTGYAEAARAERDLNEPNAEELAILEIETEQEMLDHPSRFAPTKAANQIVWCPSRTTLAKQERKRVAKLSALDRILALPQRNRHERRRREALLRQTQHV